MIPRMLTLESDRSRVAPRPLTASAVAAFRVDRFDSDGPRVALPRPEIGIVVRFGPAARNNLDAHALGTRPVAHRKHIRGGQWAITARLHLGASREVLGVPASTLAGSIVALEDLWGDSPVQRLLDQLSDAKNEIAAVEILDRAIAERFAPTVVASAGKTLVREAAANLKNKTVNSVATDLGISERHLRRVFREAVGMSPKAFARLSRFHHALRIARDGARRTWAHIAAEAGYYDQSHLVEEFRVISGVTPRVLLGEFTIPE